MHHWGKARHPRPQHFPRFPRRFPEGWRPAPERDARLESSWPEHLAPINRSCLSLEIENKQKPLLFHKSQKLIWNAVSCPIRKNAPEVSFRGSDICRAFIRPRPAERLHAGEISLLSLSSRWCSLHALENEIDLFRLVCTNRDRLG